jgi:hypothetical protein
MLTVAGAAVGQSVNVTVKRGWHEAPLLNAILVARPGKAKSPAIGAVVGPLAEIDRRLRKESKEARESWDEAKKAHAEDPKNNPPPGPEPPQLRAIVKDITRESLVIVLMDNPRGVLCDPDEATGWVASFNEYKGKGGADRQFWLSIWSSKAVSTDRKGGRESTYVPHPFVSVLAGMPPAMLSSLAEERGRDDGFTDRIIFCFPDEIDFPSQHWSEAELSEGADRTWADAVHRLHATAMVTDAEDELPRPFYVSFTPEGKRAWVAWFNAHADEVAAPDFPEGRAGAWSKMRAHAARFALILSRLQWACRTKAGPKPPAIDEEAVRGAVALVRYFKAHLVRVRHEMTGGVGSADAKAILDWIRRRRQPTFREADIGADLRRFREAPRALTDALKALCHAGAIRPRQETYTRGRRSSPGYEVHPDLLGAPENTGNPGMPRDRPTSRRIPGLMVIPGAHTIRAGRTDGRSSSYDPPRARRAPDGSGYPPGDPPRRGCPERGNHPRATRRLDGAPASPLGPLGIRRGRVPTAIPAREYRKYRERRGRGWELP